MHFLLACQPFPGLSSLPSLDHTRDYLNHSLPSLCISSHMLAATPALHVSVLGSPPPLSYCGTRTLYHKNYTATQVVLIFMVFVCSWDISIISQSFHFSWVTVTPIPYSSFSKPSYSRPLLLDPDSIAPYSKQMVLPLRKIDHIQLDLLQLPVSASLLLHFSHSLVGTFSLFPNLCY